MLFSKFDNDNIQSVFEEVRIDEVIFEALEQIRQSFPELKMEFVIADNAEESFLTINRVHSLLVVVFNNLLKNAAVYFVESDVEVLIVENINTLIVDIISTGNTIAEEE